MGAGTERVEEQFQALYPGVSVDVLDADAARRTGGAAAVLERFASGRTQVLIGTQMVSKGHHFPRVALAAVLHADTYLAFPDFRAVERTYALLTQLAGRAGRGERPGRVVIQTFHPDHYAIRAALEHDDRAFAAEEMRFRKLFHYPPYSRLVQVLSRHADRERAEAALQRLAERCQQHPHAGEVRITGPAPAPLERLRGKWRFQLLLRGSSARRLRQLVEETVGHDAGGELVVDVDPYDLM
jgi:primosomal protein N' (replication factor Y)